MIKKGVLYTDGGARGNPGPAAVGVLICDEKGAILREHGEVIGEATNNVAEYTAVLVGFELARQLGIEQLQYFGDSELVVYQLSGKYRVKMPHLQNLFNQVKVLEKSFKKVIYQQIPRTHEKIRYVDGLVNKALDEDRYS